MPSMCTSLRVWSPSHCWNLYSIPELPDDPHFNKIRIIGNKVAVPDTDKNRLSLFNLRGELIKHIDYSHIADVRAGITTCTTNAPGGTLIVSVSTRNLVFRVDIETGLVLWFSDHVERPQGVICYKDSYVLVTSYNSERKLWILDVHSG